MSKKRERLTKKSYGRQALLDWLNESLTLSYKKVEETANGAAFCQIVDMVHPGTVPLGRVNFAAKLPHDCMENLKILQEACTKNGIAMAFDVEPLSKGRYVPALQVLQYLHGYVRQLGWKGSYDAVAKREQVKCKVANERATPSIGETTVRGVPMLAQSLKRRNMLSGMSDQSNVDEEPEPEAVSLPPVPSTQATAESSALLIADLRKAVASLQKSNKRLKSDVESMTEERDFYYEKLRKVEECCQDHDGEVEYMKVLDILYETDEARGFIPPDEAMEEDEED